MGIELVAPSYKLQSQLLKIINLTIKYNTELARSIMHWLMPSGGEVDDCKTPMSQTNTTVRRPPFASIIGTAMSHCVAAKCKPDAARNRCARDCPDYAAHV